MVIKRAPDIRPSEITDETLYLRRREFMKAAAVPAVAALAGLSPTLAFAQDALPNVRKGVVTLNEALTPWEDVTTYNNFYEFGTDKGDPARNAKSFRARPWTVKIDGLVNKPGDYNLDDLLAPHALEERVYRLRCVEAWSMVIPWVGFPLKDLIKRVEPQGGAKFVEFTTLHDPQADARPARGRARLAVRRRPAPGRGHASADDPGRRPVREGPAEPERRAAAAGGALEVRLQEHQVDRRASGSPRSSRCRRGRPRRRRSTASTPT